MVLFGLAFPTCIAVHAQAIMQSTYTVLPWNNSGWYRGAVNVEGGFTLIARPAMVDSTDVFDIVLLHTGPEGDLLWSTEYNIPGSQAAVGIASDPSGGSWVLAEENDLGPRAMLAHVAADDIPDWIWMVDAPMDTEIRFFSMVVMQNEDLVIVGHVQTEGLGSNTLVLRVAGDGAIVWSRLMTGPAFHAIYSVTRTPDDHIVLAGNGTNGSGGTGIAVVEMDGTGTVVWSRSYGNDILNKANSIVSAPWGGFLITGRTGVNATGRGIVIRTDVNGIPSSMSLFEHEVINGYPLADGSEILFIEHPGGVANMQRTTAAGAVPWVAGLGLSLGSTQLLSYAEGSRYAFFSGDAFINNTINVTTLNAQCQTCSGAPGTAVLPTPILLDEFELTVQSVPYAMNTVPVDWSVSSFVAAGQRSCMLTGIQEEGGSSSSACVWDANGMRCLLSSPPAAGSVVKILDAVGREVASLNGYRDGGRLTVDLSRMDVPSGVHVLVSGSGAAIRTCRFIAP